jgi:hypothetical protein
MDSHAFKAAADAHASCRTACSGNRPPAALYLLKVVRFSIPAGPFPSPRFAPQAGGLG